jgi:hypothetical protein
LKGAWLQPLEPVKKWVQAFACKFNVYRYAKDVSENAEVTRAISLAQSAMDVHTLAGEGKLPIVRRMLNDAGEGSGLENALDAAAG